MTYDELYARYLGANWPHFVTGSVARDFGIMILGYRPKRYIQK